jgi:hypothetical protein
LKINSFEIYFLLLLLIGFHEALDISITQIKVNLLVLSFLVLQSGGRNNRDLFANSANIVVQFLIFDISEMNHD